MNAKELNRQLLEAAEKGDTDRIWELVELGADVNASNEYGRTALWFAAEYGNLTPELLDVFITYGADVNAQTNDGRTVLIYAARYGHLTPELLKTFISHGADMNARDEYGRTALMWSVLWEHLTPEFLEALISGGADVTARDKDGWTALIWAAGNGHLTPELLEAFMKNGADVNARDKWGKTAMMWSAEYGNLTPELLKAFVQHGADLEAAYEYLKKKNNLTPELDSMFCEAMKKKENASPNAGSKEKSAMNQEELNRQLFEAAKKGDFDRILELVELGADVNAQDRWGWTALIWSARSGQLTPELLKTFISHGADINARDDENGWTALIWSAQDSNFTPELLKTFISHGADINAQDRWGYTALMRSAYNGILTPELLKTFISHGANINARDKDGWTVLIWSAYEEHLTPELLEAFISHGADLEAAYEYLKKKNNLTPELDAMFCEAMKKKENASPSAGSIADGLSMIREKLASLSQNDQSDIERVCGTFKRTSGRLASESLASDVRNDLLSFIFSDNGVDMQTRTETFIRVNGDLIPDDVVEFCISKTDAVQWADMVRAAGGRFSENMEKLLDSDNVILVREAMML